MKQLKSKILVNKFLLKIFIIFNLPSHLSYIYAVWKCNITPSCDLLDPLAIYLGTLILLVMVFSIVTFIKRKQNREPIEIWKIIVTIVLGLALSMFITWLIAFNPFPTNF